MSGPEGSSIKRQVGCAAGLPGLSGVVLLCPNEGSGSKLKTEGTQRSEWIEWAEGDRHLLFFFCAFENAGTWLLRLKMVKEDRKNAIMRA